MCCKLSKAVIGLCRRHWPVRWHLRHAVNNEKSLSESDLSLSSASSNPVSFLCRALDYFFSFSLVVSLIRLQHVQNKESVREWTPKGAHRCCTNRCRSGSKRMWPQTERLSYQPVAGYEQTADNEPVVVSFWQIMLTTTLLKLNNQNEKYIYIWLSKLNELYLCGSESEMMFNVSITS